jgi:hypothetical protein
MLLNARITVLPAGGVEASTATAGARASAFDPKRAYLIAHVQVTDPDGWKQYIAALPATLEPYHVKTGDVPVWACR